MSPLIHLTDFFQISKLAKSNATTFLSDNVFLYQKGIEFIIFLLQPPVAGIYMCVTLPIFPTLFSFTWLTYIVIHSVNLYHLMKEIKLHWWRCQYLFIYGLYIHYSFIISIKYNLIMVSSCPTQHKYTLHPYILYIQLDILSLNTKSKAKNWKPNPTPQKIKQKIRKQNKNFIKQQKTKHGVYSVLLNYSWA